MGRFLEAVQRDEIQGPFRRKFNLDKWTEEFEKLNSDAVDKDLFLAGIAIYKKAKAIRNSLKITFSNQLRATTKVRGFASIVNFNHCMLRQKTIDAFQKITSANDIETPVMAHELAAVKIEMPSGANLGPSEIVQSMIDGVQIPLKRILEQNPALKGNSEFGRLDWKDVGFDFNLGNMYSLIEALWDDCLWNSFKIAEIEGQLIFAPDNKTWLTHSIVTRVRLDALAREFATHAYHARFETSFISILHSLGSLNAHTLLKQGRKQLIKLVPYDVFSDEGIRLLTLRGYASEPYYTELLSEPQSLLKGSTLNQLISAWMIISSTADLLRKEVEGIDFEESDNPNSWLPNFAPVIQVSALQQAITSGCTTTWEQSNALVEFFIFRGTNGQELWAQPLVPVSNETVVPIFAAVTSPNLRRLVDVWLRQLGVDLGARGPAFEAYIRTSIQQSIATSPLLKESAFCFESNIRFRPIGNREEEIDVLFAIGNVVILGEAKCFLEPSEPKEIAFHRNKVRDAVAQIKRKAASVEANREEFRARISELGLTLAEDFKLYPIVILNSAFHAGIAIDGVPIVDEHILNVFFDGKYIELAVQEKNKGIRPLKKKILYSSSSEASNVIHDFLSSPPQLKPLLDGLQERWIPVLSITETDWKGQFLALDCIPKMDLGKDSILDQL